MRRCRGGSPPTSRARSSSVRGTRCLLHGHRPAAQARIGGGRPSAVLPDDHLQAATHRVDTADLVAGAALVAGPLDAVLGEREPLLADPARNAEPVALGADD